MERNRKTPRSARHTTVKPAFHLPPDHAFVLHLDTSARPPRRVTARIEHITSGQVAHVTSMRQLGAFLAAALRKKDRQD